MIVSMRKAIATVLATIIMLVSFGRIEINRSGQATEGEDGDETAVTRQVDETAVPPNHGPTQV